METAIQRTLADDGTALVVVVGEIDFTNAEDVSRCIEDAILQWQPSTVLVDLAGAAFIDSTGLGALIAGYRVATDSDCTFTVTNVTPTFQRVLEVTGLCELFGIAARDESHMAM